MSVHDYLKRSVWYLDSGCSRHMTRAKQYLHRYLKESGPKVVVGDNSLGDTEGYGSVNCNGITFTRVAYVNGLKHNLISIIQLCDANFKVLFTKTQGTIFNQNDEVVLIAPRRRDVYVIDMSSYNEESNAFFFVEASPSMENLNETKVKQLRSDNGTKFRNHTLEVFCDEKVHIYNHRDHLGKFNEKEDDGFFLGYSLVAKAFRFFNIRRQEMEETFHVTFSEDDEAISQTSIEGNSIKFNEVSSFPDDEFLEPRNIDTLCTANTEYFPYVPAFDCLSTNSHITPPETPTPLVSSTPIEPPMFTNEDDIPARNEADHPESTDDLNIKYLQKDIRVEQISEVHPSP
ncbi:retrovirus-related pol polyprotein from transposon TNT 1-94 [Tanacetum coccineum]